MSRQQTEVKAYCPDCGTEYGEDRDYCPKDGTELYDYHDAQDPGRDQLIGTTLSDRFEINKLLGEGGMGKVYVGTQLSVDRDVAIKVLQSNLVQDDEAVKRFFREARVISGLNHPNIIQLYDFGQESQTGLLYYVMEMVSGRELGSLLKGDGDKKRRLHAELALEITQQTCRGLAEPHAEGIIHRDLKPENLMVVPMADGRIQVKILDFGLARALTANSNLTKTGNAYGTAHYMPPEQARGGEMGPPADIYALGVLLFEMLAGRYMFNGETPMQIMLNHIQEPPPNLADFPIASELPAGLPQLVGEMVSKDAGDRPESVLEVQQRIDEIRHRAGITSLAIDVNSDLEEALADWIAEPAARADQSGAAGSASHSTRESDQLVNPTGDTALEADSPETTPSAASGQSIPDTASVASSEESVNEPRESILGSQELAAAAEQFDNKTLGVALLASLLLAAGGAFFLFSLSSDSNSGSPADDPTASAAADSPTGNSGGSANPDNPTPTATESDDQPGSTGGEAAAAAAKTGADETKSESGNAATKATEGEKPSDESSPSASSKQDEKSSDDEATAAKSDDESGDEPMEFGSDDSESDDKPADDDTPSTDDSSDDDSSEESTATASKDSEPENDGQESDDEPSGSPSPTEETESTSDPEPEPTQTADSEPADSSSDDEAESAGDDEKKKKKEGLNVFAID